MYQLIDKNGKISSSDAKVIVIDKNGKVKQIVSGGTGSAVWGSITGTLTSQTDLTSYLTTNYYPLTTNPSGYLTSSSLTGYVPNTRTLTINGTTFDLTSNRTWSVGDLLSSGSYANPSWLTSLAYSKLTGTPTIPTVGSWGALNYPTWTSGTPFVKMTATGTFSLDTNIYLTSITSSNVTTALGFTPYNSTNPSSFIPLTALSSTATGLTYTNTTGVFSLTSGYLIPTTSSYNNTNWDTAYTDRNKWDGGSIGLVASTGRTSLGATTVGSNLFTLTNPSSITFPRINADNTVSTLDAATFRVAIGAGTSSTTGTVTSVAALTLGTTGTDLSSSVATGTTTPVITLNVPTASATNRGALSSTDWTTFNNKQVATSAGILFTLGYYNYKNTTSSSTLTGSLTETQLLQVTIPANTFSASDFLKFTAMFSKTGIVSTVTYRFKLSTSATMPSGATGQIAVFVTTLTNLFIQVDRRFAIKGGNITGFPFTGTSINDYNVSNAGLGSVAFDPTVTNYFYVSATLSTITTTSDSTFLNSTQITNI